MYDSPWTLWMYDSPWTLWMYDSPWTLWMCDPTPSGHRYILIIADYHIKLPMHCQSEISAEILESGMHWWSLMITCVIRSHVMQLAKNTSMMQKRWMQVSITFMDVSILPPWEPNRNYHRPEWACVMQVVRQAMLGSDTELSGCDHHLRSCWWFEMMP